jgi:hypothetical protein
MGVVPKLRHLIACKKEPTVSENGVDVSLHDIFCTVHAKPPHQYPLWQKPFYVFAMLVGARGDCELQIEVRLVEWDANLREAEVRIAASRADRHDFQTHPLRVVPVSIFMPPVPLAKRGVYRLYLICEGIELGYEEIDAI